MAHTKLKIATYMCPSLPVEYFEAVSQYIEETLLLYTSLEYETRWDGPPPDRPDPFEGGDIDIAFISTSAYTKMKEENVSFDLLPLSSVHLHPKGENNVPGYFADVITHSDSKDRVKEFIDLRGCSWAVNNRQSVSGNVVPLMTLKQLGENSSFFGSILQSGSHLKSINMVLDKQADAASVDSNALSYFLSTNPQLRNELFVVESWGPLAPYPVVVNSSLPGGLKDALTKALLEMHQSKKYAPLLAKCKVQRFVENCPEVYQKERQAVLKQGSAKSIESIYY